jgi:hypothetical protein
MANQQPAAQPNAAWWGVGAVAVKLDEIRVVIIYVQVHAIVNYFCSSLPDHSSILSLNIIA